MSRARQLRKKMRKGLPRPDGAGMSAESPRERGRAVRSACPCRVGWEAYEENLGDLARLTKDPDPVVRFNALHVREDAALMELLEDKRQRAADAEERRAQRAAAKEATERRRARRPVQTG